MPSTPDTPPTAPGVDVAEGRRLLGEATEGPWFWPYGNCLAGGAGGDPEGPWATVAAIHDAGPMDAADGDLIAFLRNNASDLLDAVAERDRLREVVTEALGQVAAARQHHDFVSPIDGESLSHWQATATELVEAESTLRAALSSGVPEQTRRSKMMGELLAAPGLGGPGGDVGPVPGGPTADGPAGFGQDAAGAPHVDGAALDTEAGGDLGQADRLGVHDGHCKESLDSGQVCRDNHYMTITREELDSLPDGVARTASKPWRCVCADRLRRFDVVRHYTAAGNPAWAKRHIRIVDGDEHVARSLAEAEAEGLRVDLDNDRVEIVEIPNPNYRSECSGIIIPGDLYFEYLAEVGAYQSGSRYCAPCAIAVWSDA